MVGEYCGRRFILDRKDHRRGKNLSNFLHGVSLIAKGREEEARLVFSYLQGLPWPRSWTLGSHYALGRLGNGNLASYLDGAFFWERMNLDRHVRLLARAREQA